ncbi:hypothetical protein [Kosmotoga pacifica]|uniref:Uncharacterized protein n=1 Tax=Kosmotoga pacifica TaxID=1330330 RepID=A0A0G2ZDZ4_9BACT|nr:hypothetical protein [Kosmotoga pacifica]AKI97028.1 hypothetical protein IX53_03415 [Kosmotoga pacifica]
MRKIALSFLLIVVSIAMGTNLLEIDTSGFPIVKLTLEGAERVDILENGSPVDVFSIEKDGDLLYISYFSNEEDLKGQKIELRVNEVTAHYNVPLTERTLFSALVLEDDEIIVDGNIEDWDHITGIRFISDYNVKGVPISGRFDLSGVAKMAYGKSNSLLYGLVIVRDDVPIPAFSKEIIGFGDSIHLKVEDISYDLLPGNFINYEPSILTSSPVENTKISCTLMNGYYIYEFAVPITKGEGKHQVKLSMSIIDNDRPKASEKSEWKIIDNGKVEFFAESLPIVRITSPKDGDIFSKPYVVLSGTVSGDYRNVIVRQERIGYTGDAIPVEERVLSIDKGTFRDSFILKQGENVFTVLATSTSGKAISSVRVLYPIEASLRFILKWDDPKADLDLNVLLPSGERIYFVNPGPPGKLHVADTEEALEIYEIPFAEVEPGSYQPMVHFFENKGAKKVKGTITVELSDGTGRKTPKELFKSEFSFNGSEANPTDTTTGTDWRYFEPIRIKIPEVALRVSSNLPEEFKSIVTYQIGSIEHKEGFVGTFELGNSLKVTLKPTVFELDTNKDIEGNDVKFEFYCWDDGSRRNERKVVINEPTMLTANFKRFFKVLLLTVDERGNELLNRRQYWVEEGKEITLSSGEFDGMLFHSWVFNGQIVSTKKSDRGFVITGPSVIVRKFIKTSDVMLIAPDNSTYDLESLQKAFVSTGLSINLYSPETILLNPGSLSKARVIFLGFSTSKDILENFFSEDLTKNLKSYIENGGLVVLSGDGNYLLEKLGLARLEKVKYLPETYCVPLKLLYGPEDLFSDFAFPANESLVQYAPETMDFFWKSEKEFNGFTISDYLGNSLPIYFVEGLYINGENHYRTYPLLLWKLERGEILYIGEVWNGVTSSSESAIKLVERLVNVIITSESRIVKEPSVESAVLRGDVISINLKKPTKKFYELWALTEDGKRKYISTSFIEKETEIPSSVVELNTKLMLRTLSGIHHSRFSEPVKITVPQPVYYEVSDNIVEVFSDELKMKKIKMREFSNTEKIFPIEYDLNNDSVNDLILIRQVKAEGTSKSNLIISALKSDVSLLWEEPFGEGKVYTLPLSYSVKEFGAFYAENDVYIYVVANGDDGNFSVTSVYSRYGELISEFWHPGPINAVLVGDLNLDGRKEILLAGYNYHYDAADYIVIDPIETGVAQCPPGRGFFYPVNDGLFYEYFTGLAPFVSVTETGAGTFELKTANGRVERINLLAKK